MASLLVVPMLGDKPLAQAATGFVVHDAGTDWLVTNWHVVSGRRTDDGRPLSQRTGAVPDRLRVAQNLNGQVAWVDREYELRTPDGEPRWVEHPLLRRRADVTALRISAEPGVQFYPYELDEEGDQLTAGMGPGQSGSPVIAFVAGGAARMESGSTNVYNGPITLRRPASRRRKGSSPNHNDLAPLHCDHGVVGMARVTCATAC